MLGRGEISGASEKWLERMETGVWIYTEANADNTEKWRYYRTVQEFEQSSRRVPLSNQPCAQNRSIARGNALRYLCTRHCREMGRDCVGRKNIICLSD